MRTAVTGAAGFIGSHLCEALLAAGHTVVGIDSLTEAYGRGHKLANLSGLRSHPRFRFHVADVTHPASGELICGSDAICHLAGLGGARSLDQHTLEQANIESVRAVVDAAARVGVPRILLASSSAVYRPRSRPLSEDSELGPVSPYGKSKLRGEEIARQRTDASGVGLVVVRYFSVYGPRQRPDMAFARYIQAAQTGAPMPRFGEGEQRRDFTFVSDIVSGTIAALHRGIEGRIYNLAAGRSVALVHALALLDRRLGGRRVRLLPRTSPVPEPTATAADLSRAQDELGYRPAVGLTEGLAIQLADSWLMISNTGNPTAITAAIHPIPSNTPNA